MWRNKPAARTPIDRDPEETDVDVRLQTAGRRDLQGIAKGLRVTGEIEGDQDLSIAGEVSGSVFLPNSEILVGSTAGVHADITARVIDVEGNVTGDLTALERVVIRGSSVVTGDVVSPQVQLEEGCRFKGSVQMRVPDVQREPPARSGQYGGPGAVSGKSATA